MEFNKFEHKSGHQVTWFALDKDKFQSIFEDALNEMSQEAKEYSQRFKQELSDSKDDIPKVKVENIDEYFIQEEMTCLNEIKFEEGLEAKVKAIDEVLKPSEDISTPAIKNLSFTDLRIIPHQFAKHSKLTENPSGVYQRRALTPELNRKQNSDSLKRSHSSTDLLSRVTSTLLDSIVPSTEISDSESTKKEESNGNLEKASVENKKNFVSIENILSQDSFNKKSCQQAFKNGELLEDLSNLDLKYYNVSKSTSNIESFPVRCGWFGIDKKIFSGIVDTLSQIYFENFARSEFVGLNSSKFNLANDTQALESRVQRAVDFNDQHPWYASSYGCRKNPKSHDYYSQNVHSKLYKDRLPRSSQTNRPCFVEHGKPPKRSFKLTSRMSHGKGKDFKRKEKVVNSSCVSSSTTGSSGKDVILPNKTLVKCPSSANTKTEGKESWIRVDKSLVNGMVDFLVEQLYPESSDLFFKKSEIKQESRTNPINSTVGDPISKSVNNIRGSFKGNNDSKTSCNSPSTKRGSDRKNYSIGFLSKSDSKGQKSLEGETNLIVNPSEIECNSSGDKIPQNWKPELTQEESLSRGYQSPISYWNPGPANSHKEAILT